LSATIIKTMYNDKFMLFLLPCLMLLLLCLMLFLYS